MITWEEAVKRLRADKENSRLVEACFFDDPILAASERYYTSTEWIEIRDILPKSVGRSLDIGAGRGMVSYALAKDGWQATALEPDPSLIVGAGAIRSLSEEAALNITVVQEWGEGLPFPAASFDLVICRQVLHHARNLPDFCREAGRVLKPGGLFLGLREHVIDRGEDLPVFLDKHPLHRLYGGENAFLLDDYLAALRVGGLKVDKVLNSFESNINLYPLNKVDVKRRWAKRIGLPCEKIVPDWALKVRGAVLRTPGRIFSFIAHKK